MSALVNIPALMRPLGIIELIVFALLTNSQADVLINRRQMTQPNSPSRRREIVAASGKQFLDPARARILVSFCQTVLPNANYFPTVSPECVRDNLIAQLITL